MTNQCGHGQLARVCELCEKDAEIAQLRQYLDTAQRRAAALGDEVAKLREDALQRYVNHDLLTGTRGKMNEIARAALEQTGHND